MNFIFVDKDKEGRKIHLYFIKNIEKFKKRIP